jgi:hypothetical protein
MGAKSSCSQNIIDDFDNLRVNINAGIKKITEKSFSKWTIIYFHDSTGFLVRQFNYYKNKPRADYRHEYTITDSLILRREYFNMTNNEKDYSDYKYYYKFQKLYKMEIYLSSDSLSIPSILADNFIYKDNLLQSYKKGRFPHTKEDPPDKILYI